MKPGDFFVGVIDFFSILLPGTFLTGAIAAILPMPPVLEGLLASETAKWVAFALAGYALGHFTFLVAARLDGLYDKYRDWKWQGFRGSGKPLQEATALRRAQFPIAGDDLPMNTLDWAKSILLLRAPAALAEVERYEASSKFFRSMTLVLPLLGLAATWLGFWPMLPLGGAMAVLSFGTFAKLRFKSSDWAYKYVIVLDRLGELEKGRTPAKSGRAGDDERD